MLPCIFKRSMPKTVFVESYCQASTVVLEACFVSVSFCRHPARRSGQWTLDSNERSVMGLFFSSVHECPRVLFTTYPAFFPPRQKVQTPSSTIPMEARVLSPPAPRPRPSLVQGSPRCIVPCLPPPGPASGFLGLSRITWIKEKTMVVVLPKFACL